MREVNNPHLPYHADSPYSGSPNNSMLGGKNGRVKPSAKDPDEQKDASGGCCGGGRGKTFRYFAEITSFQGIPYINRSSNVIVKTLWTLLFTGAVVVCTLHAYSIMNTFLKRDVTTQVDITYDTLDFPSVTLCNMNAVRISKVKQAGEDIQEFLESLQPFDDYDDDDEDEENVQAPPQTTQATPVTVPANPPPSSTIKRRRKRESDDEFNPFKSLSNVSAGYETYLDDDDEDREQFGDGDIATEFKVDEVFKDLLSQIDGKVRVRIGHRLKSMLLACQFNGRTCGAKDFHASSNPDHGNCYTFNAATLKKSPLKSRESGSQYGLKLVMYIEKSEYISGITDGSGLKVDIHPYNTMPFPEHHGTSVSPGASTSLAMRMITLARKGKPYKACEKGRQFSADYNHTYTIEGCVHTCLDKHIARTCNCYRSVYSGYYKKWATSNLKACRSEKEMECVYRIRQRSEKGNVSCECLQSCEQTSYSVEYSMNSWPDQVLWHSLVNRVCKKNNDSCAYLKDLGKDKDDRQDILRENFLSLNIYYRELNFETISESAAYETGQFLSDFGGAMGLWMGASALTILELVDLVVRLIQRCCKSRKSKGDRHNAQNEQDDNTRDRSRHPHNGDSGFHERYGLDHVRNSPMSNKRLPRFNP